MKNRIILLIAAGLLFYNYTSAQTKSYVFELNGPEKDQTLKIDVYNAAIKVSGHKENKVKLTFIDERKGKAKDIGGIEFYYTVFKEDNSITILNRDSHKRRIKGLVLEVKVPEAFSLDLATYFGPQIEIANVNGKIKTKGYFTNITISDIQNQLNVETSKGKVKTIFNTLPDFESNHIENYDGDIEIYLPHNTDATLLMDNHFGNYYSDFDLGINLNKNTQNHNLISRKINNGGSELRLINYFGKISILSKNNKIILK